MHLCSQRNVHRLRARNFSKVMLDYIIRQQRAGRSYGGNLTQVIVDGEPDPGWLCDGVVIGHHAIATSIGFPSEKDPSHSIVLYTNNICTYTALGYPRLPDCAIDEVDVFEPRMRAVDSRGLKDFLRDADYKIEHDCPHYAEEEQLFNLPQLTRVARQLQDETLRTIVLSYQGRLQPYMIESLTTLCARASDPNLFK